MNLSNKQLNELDIILKYNDRSLFLFITTNNTNRNVNDDDEAFIKNYSNILSSEYSISAIL